MSLPLSLQDPVDIRILQGDTVGSRFCAKSVSALRLR